MSDLRSLVKEIILSESGHKKGKDGKVEKSVRVSAPYSTDLGLILQWGRSLKLFSGGVPKKAASGYYALVKPKKTREKIRNELKSRFGTFVSVR